MTTNTKVIHNNQITSFKPATSYRQKQR